MGLIVREKAEYLATFRWMEVFLMEMLARWVPTTPEMEVKVLMGRHIWDAAQHADALGKRTFELRAPLHYTLAPLPAYVDKMNELASIEDTVLMDAGIMADGKRGRVNKADACTGPISALQIG